MSDSLKPTKEPGELVLRINSMDKMNSELMDTLNHCMEMTNLIVGSPSKESQDLPQTDSEKPEQYELTRFSDQLEVLEQNLEKARTVRNQLRRIVG